MSIYNDSGPWTPPNNSYPTWDNVMRYYMSRVHSPGLGPGPVSKRTVQTSPDKVINDLALFCISAWESGDGCPKKLNAVKDQFKAEVLHNYQKYRKGDIDSEEFKPKNKKKKKKDLEAPAAVPSRKSSRQLSTSPGDDGDSEPAACAAPLKQGQAESSVSTRSAAGPCRYTAWLRDHGTKLFDIFSLKNMETRLAEGKAFDSDFYEDQKDIERRSLVIQTMRVRIEFYENEKKLELTKARKFARTMSALGSGTTSTSQDNPDASDDDNIPDSPFKTPAEDINPSCTRQRLSTVTRSTVVRSLQNQIAEVITIPATTNTLIDKASQTSEILLGDIKDCDMPLVSTRKKTSKKGSKQARLVSPAYLQSGALMMSIATMSSSQAVLAMKIHDETVYRQTRHLPLILNKKYKRKFKLLKKYQAIKSKESSTGVLEDIRETVCIVDEDEDGLSENEQQDETVTDETEDTQKDSDSIIDDDIPAAKKAKMDDLENSLSAYKYQFQNRKFI